MYEIEVTVTTSTRTQLQGFREQYRNQSHITISPLVMGGSEEITLLFLSVAALVMGKLEHRKFGCCSSTRLSKAVNGRGGSKKTCLFCKYCALSRKNPALFRNLQISRFIEFCSPLLRSSANPLLELISLDFGGCDTIGSSHHRWFKRPTPTLSPSLGGPLYLKPQPVSFLAALAVALYLNRRLWPLTALNSWTGGLSIGLNSWKHCT